MTTLEKIIQAKHRRIGIQKLSNSFTDHYINNDSNVAGPKFFDSLIKSNNEYKIIAEMKKASPSAGLIVEDYKPDLIAQEYEKKEIGRAHV